MLIVNKEPFPGYSSFYKFQNDVKNGKRPNLNNIDDEFIKNFYQGAGQQMLKNVLTSIRLLKN